MIKRYSLFTILILVSISLIIFSTSAIFAQEKFPTKTIEIIVPFGAGGGTDIYIRQIARALSKVLGVNVITTNMPGAGSMRGLGALSGSTPDGYTLAAFNPPSSTMAQLVQKPGFDLSEFVALVRYARDSEMLCMHSDLPYETLPEVIEAYKNGEISMIGTQYEGTIAYVAALRLEESLGLDFGEFITYGGGGEVQAALMRKEVPVGTTTVTAVKELVKDGVLKPICVSTDERHPSLPDVPSIIEFGYPSIDEVANTARIIAAPPKLPEEIKEILEDALLKALEDEELLKWSEETETPVNSAPAEVAQMELENSFKLEEVLKKLGLVD